MMQRNLYIVFGALALMLVATASLYLVGINHINESWSRYRQLSQRKAEGLSTLHHLLKHQGLFHSFRAALHSKDNELLKIYQDHSQLLAKQLEAYEPSTTTVTERVLLGEAKKIRERWDGYLFQEPVRRELGIGNQILPSNKNRIYADKDLLGEIYNGLESENRSHLAQYINRIENRKNYLAYGVPGFLLIIVVLIGIFFRRLLSDVKNYAKVMSLVGEQVGSVKQLLDLLSSQQIAGPSMANTKGNQHQLLVEHHEESDDEEKLQKILSHEKKLH